MLAPGDSVTCPLTKKEVDLLVHHYHCESLRWDRANGEGHLIDAALDQYDYWLEVQAKWIVG